MMIKVKWMNKRQKLHEEGRIGKGQWHLNEQY